MIPKHPSNLTRPPTGPAPVARRLLHQPIRAWQRQGQKPFPTRTPALYLLYALLFMVINQVLAASRAQEQPGEAVSASAAIPPAEATAGNVPTSATQPPAAPLPLELQPYRVCISIAFGKSPLLSAAFRQSVLAETGEQTDRYLGAMWHAESTENVWLPGTSLHVIADLNSETLRGQSALRAYDKTFLLAVETRGSGYWLSGREWDATLQQLGAPQSQQVLQRREVAAALTGLMLKLFRPLAAIDPFDEGTVPVRVQAAAFPPSDPDQAQLRDGQLWQPFYRYLNKTHAIDRVQSIPWTYLKVESLDSELSPGHAECRLLSGLRSPLTNRRRPRIEALAMALQSSWAGTRLKVLSQSQKGKPLIGFEIHVIKERELPPRQLYSDRSGSVIIPVDPEYPLIWLRIGSGQDILARLPFVPGVHAAETIDLPEDSIRLRVEGELSMLQAILMDAVAERAVVIARIRKSAHDGDWAKVDPLLNSLTKLPSITIFLSQLNAIRIPAIKAARDQKDRVGAGRIDALCKETSQLIERYLDPDKVRVIHEELAELRKELKENVDSLPPPLDDDREDVPLEPADSDSMSDSEPPAEEQPNGSRF